MIGLVYREPAYSPGDNVSKDAAVLETVGKTLTKRGKAVKYLQAEDMAQPDVLDDMECCVSMARGPYILAHLISYMHKGIPFLNSPEAVLLSSTSRDTNLSFLESEGLPVAPYMKVSLSCKKYKSSKKLPTYLPGWIKGMNLNGVNPGDVCKVETVSEADSRILSMFTNPKYLDIIVMRHLEGPLQKVYVVGDKCWPQCECSELALKVRETVNLNILGVDFIMTSDGPYIIDVNDFPSFSSCREEAAEAIADLVCSPNLK